MLGSTPRRNDIVVMDNCRVYMAPAVKRAIEKASVRYLPKYSPDLNPIELPYSKFRHICVRSRHEQFRISLARSVRSSHN
ncbi:transposase [Bradyrhizobium valentinum]|uniref:transposase n=1 Tax=Bradyrhizobium valentinum TaxID=1518501 RepID=UPI0012E3ED40